MRLSYQHELIEAGCDEAGRGCLAGPVFAAAVILPPDFQNSLLTDSKQLSEKQRNKLRVIIKKEAVSYAVAQVTPQEIDQINIRNASFLAMHKAINKLSPKPQLLLIDGNAFNPYPQIHHLCIIKGDGLYLNIAAASVLAKTYRDDYMSKLHDDYPQYLWQSNKGYPTKAHRKAIEDHGITVHHRRSFRLSNQQLKFNFSS